ncbi:MAG: hypothetical protein CM1200mP26_11980 [Acidimicrobiales bacterium]|nr:MAG: hypothetical protein CM1200mP26_11980 [Acidimicrobiales bacterium]
MRAVEWEGLEPDDEWHEAMDTCVQCLGWRRLPLGGALR